MKRCLLVTRPQPQADHWVSALRADGLRAAALPLMAIEPLVDPSPVAKAWSELTKLGFVMFVSGNAVAQFFAARPAGCTWPAALRAGATGPGTAAALRQVGLGESQVIMPMPGESPLWDAESLWRRIEAWPWAGQRVLVVRGESGRDWLADQWGAAGATVLPLAAYRRVLPVWSPPETALLHDEVAAPEAYAWLFSSSEAVGNLTTLAARPDALRWQRSLALATHPRIAQTARQVGFGQVVDVEPSLSSVARVLRLSRTEADGLASLQSAASS